MIYANYCNVSYSTTTNPVDKSDLMLPGLQSVDDHLISGPASVPTSDQQFVTPQNSNSPSMHSLCNSSQPTTPTSNTAVEDLTSEVNSKLDTDISTTITGITDDVIEAGFDAGSTKQPPTSSSNTAVKDLTSEASTEPNVRRDTVTGLAEDVIESGFVLVNRPEDFQVNFDSTCDIDVEGTLKPTDLATAFRSSAVKKTRDFDAGEDDQANDTLVPAHLRVVGVHGNSPSGISIHGNNTRSKAGIQVEDQVVGITDNNFSINSEHTSVSGLSSRRKSGTVPELKIGKFSYGAGSPEYYTPTDSTYV